MKKVMHIFVLLAIVVLIIAILGTGTLIYLVVKMMAGLTNIRISSSLPRSVARSLKEARGYGRAITQVARQCPPGPMRDRLNLTIKPVDEWLASLTKLERGLEKLYHQRNPTREVRQTAFEIDSLRRQMLMAGEREMASLRMLLESKKQQLAVLKELQAFQTEAELKIRKITSDLATTHTEMLLIVARGDFNENRLSRLDENLQEHLSSMRDMLAVMDEMGYSSVAG